jgi:hypothetical protein
MIRGHIDFVSRARVEGWLFCERLNLSGASVLAFVDEACVGGGRVELLRQDLLDAGLGDGRVGFGFPVMLEPWQDPRALDVRLEGGTMRLAQGQACLVPRDSLGEDRKRQGREPGSLSWMLARGWLSQPRYETLRILGEFGVRAERLRIAAPARDLDAVTEEIALLAAEICELALLQPVELEIRENLGAEALEAIRREVRAAFPFAPPVAGLWSPGPLAIQVVEGSHRGEPAGSAAGAVEYGFGGAQLLMLDLDARARFPERPSPRFTAFVPHPPGGAAR